MNNNSGVCSGIKLTKREMIFLIHNQEKRLNALENNIILLNRMTDNIEDMLKLMATEVRVTSKQD